MLYRFFIVNYLFGLIKISSFNPYDELCLSSKTLPSSFKIFLFSNNIAFNKEVATVILISFLPFTKYLVTSPTPDT